MNVKKRYLLVGLLALFAVLGTACSGSGGPTPTRTPKAVAEKGDATQTPWIIYVPVTTTPEPFTVTPLATVTSAKPQQPTAAPAQPTRTKAPATAKPVSAKPTATQAIPPTAVPPSATSLPACGQTYQVSQLIFPKNNDTREVKAGGGAGKTVQFKWAPVASWELDSKLGYQIYVKTKTNSQAIYISHNGYLKVQNENGAILSQQAAYGLTQGDDSQAQWNVTVVMSSGGFDDQNFAILGTATACGPASATFLLNLKVVQ